MHALPDSSVSGGTSPEIAHDRRERRLPHPAFALGTDRCASAAERRGTYLRGALARAVVPWRATGGLGLPTDQASASLPSGASLQSPADPTSGGLSGLQLPAGRQPSLPVVLPDRR